MKTSWLIGILMLVIGASLLSGIIEMQYLGGAASTQGVLEKMFTLSWSGFKDAFWFDYAMFTGAWQIVRWLFVAVNVSVLVSLGLTLGGMSAAGLVLLVTLGIALVG